MPMYPVGNTPLPECCSTYGYDPAMGKHDEQGHHPNCTQHERHNPGRTVADAVTWFMIHWPRPSLRQTAEEMLRLGQAAGSQRFPAFTEYTVEATGKRYTINENHRVAIASEIIARLGSAKWEEPVAVARAHVGNEPQYNMISMPCEPGTKFHGVNVMYNGAKIGTGEGLILPDGTLSVSIQFDYVPKFPERRRVILTPPSRCELLPIKLEPVGAEFSGEIKPADRLTYPEAKALAVDAVAKYLGAPGIYGEYIKADGTGMVRRRTEPLTTYSIRNGEVIPVPGGLGVFNTREDAEQALQAAKNDVARHSHPPCWTGEQLGMVPPPLPDDGEADQPIII